MEQGGGIETDQRHEMGHGDLHEQIHSGNRSVDHVKQNTVLSHLGSTANSDIWRNNDYHDGSVFNGNQYDTGDRHSISLNFGGSASSGLLQPYILPASSSSTNFPFPWNSGSANYMLSSNNQIVGVLMDGYNGNNHFTENAWAHCKQKNVVQVPGYNPCFNESARSDISSPLITQGSGTSTYLEHQSNGTSGNPEGFFRNVRNISSSTVGLPQSAYICYPNDLLVANLAAQSFPHATNAWVPQLEDNIAAGGCHGWGYTNPVPMLHGKHVNSMFPGTGNIGFQRYKPVRPPLYPAHLHYSHENQLLSENIQFHNHIGYTHSQIPAPFYQYQLNNMELRNPNTSNRLHANPRFMSFASTSEQVFRPNFQLLRACEETLHQNGSLFESAGSSGLQLVHEVGNNTDEHRDMRLDIDSMSYEELLALEEQIGNVNTGLAEEFISKNLKTFTFAKECVSSMSEHEPCVVCQVEYKEGENLGALNCGHTYHSCCIKQWLLIKNLCPICKTTALANA